MGRYFIIMILLLITFIIDELPCQENNLELGKKFLKLGMTYVQGHNYEKAYEWLTKGYDIVKKKRDIYWIAVANEYLAYYYRDIGEIEKAKELLEKAKSLYKPIIMQSDGSPNAIDEVLASINNLSDFPSYVRKDYEGLKQRIDELEKENSYFKEQIHYLENIISKNALAGKRNDSIDIPYDTVYFENNRSKEEIDTTATNNKDTVLSALENEIKTLHQSIYDIKRKSLHDNYDWNCDSLLAVQNLRLNNKLLELIAKFDSLLNIISKDFDLSLQLTFEEKNNYLNSGNIDSSLDSLKKILGIIISKIKEKNLTESEESAKIINKLNSEEEKREYESTEKNNATPDNDSLKQSIKSENVNQKQEIAETTQANQRQKKQVNQPNILSVNLIDEFLKYGSWDNINKSINDSINQKKEIKILNLGPNVNSKRDDIAPFTSPNGCILYFLSDRKGSKYNYRKSEISFDWWFSKKENRKDTNFFESKNLDDLLKIDMKNINTEENEGPASLASDKENMYIAGFSYSNGLGQSDIFLSKYQEDIFLLPSNIGEKVNSERWESDPSITADKSRLYFASDRPGPNGEENFDLWYSDYDWDTEEFKNPVNLSGINTLGRELSPFICSDGKTLIFASDGYNDKENLDFYITIYDEGSNTWSKPKNLGEPINSENDELYFYMNPSGDIIYFSSKRKDLPNYQGGYDIYMMYVQINNDEK
jgi:hypothetical protein